MVSKYGTAEGDAINAQFEHVVTDSNNKCNESAAASTAPAAATVATAVMATAATAARATAARAPRRLSKDANGSKGPRRATAPITALAA